MSSIDFLFFSSFVCHCARRRSFKSSAFRIRHIDIECNIYASFDWIKWILYTLLSTYLSVYYLHPLCSIPEKRRLYIFYMISHTWIYRNAIENSTTFTYIFYQHVCQVFCGYHECGCTKCLPHTFRLIFMHSSKARFRYNLNMNFQLD